MKGVKTGICEICGKHFEYTGFKKRTTCCKACAMKAYRIKHEIEKVCLNPDCNRTFKTTNKDKKFCGGMCKNHYYSLLKKKPERKVKKYLKLSNGLEVRDDVVGQWIKYYYMDNY